MSRAADPSTDLIALVKSGTARFHSLAHAPASLPVLPTSPLRPLDKARLEREHRTTISVDLYQVLKEVVPTTPTGTPLSGLPPLSVAHQDELDDWFRKPSETAITLVEEVHAWCRDWGKRPSEIPEAAAVARNSLNQSLVPWPVSDETFLLSSGLTGACFAIYNSKIIDWKSSGVGALMWHLQPQRHSSLPFAESIPQPWADLAGVGGHIYWWDEWSDDDEDALREAVTFARRIEGGVIIEGLQSGALAVNALLRDWAVLAWDLARGTPVGREDYHDSLRVRRQLQTVVDHLPAAVASKLVDLLRPIDDRFDSSRSDSEEEWWLQRTPTNLL